MMRTARTLIRSDGKALFSRRRRSEDEAEGIANGLFLDERRTRLRPCRRDVTSWSAHIER